VLAEGPVLRDQHLFDQVRVTDEDEPLEPQPERHEVAVFAGEAREEAEHVAAERGQVAQEPVPRRTGWERRHRETSRE
jgi:hypothetical protein